MTVDSSRVVDYRKLADSWTAARERMYCTLSFPHSLSLSTLYDEDETRRTMKKRKKEKNKRPLKLDEKGERTGREEKQKKVGKEERAEKERKKGLATRMKRRHEDRGVAGLHHHRHHHHHRKSHFIFNCSEERSQLQKRAEGKQDREVQKANAISHDMP